MSTRPEFKKNDRVVWEGYHGRITTVKDKIFVQWDNGEKGVFKNVWYDRSLKLEQNERIGWTPNQS